MRENIAAWINLASHYRWKYSVTPIGDMDRGFYLERAKVYLQLAHEANNGEM